MEKHILLTFLLILCNTVLTITGKANEFSDNGTSVELCQIVSPENFQILLQNSNYWSSANTTSEYFHIGNDFFLRNKMLWCRHTFRTSKSRRVGLICL